LVQNELAASRAKQVTIIIIPIVIPLQRVVNSILSQRYVVQAHRCTCSVRLIDNYYTADDWWLQFWDWTCNPGIWDSEICNPEIPESHFRD